ncbi:MULTISPECIES: phosphatidate cytidylyltransferase [Terrabacteria group]|uniref:phosphatidate cytidylyltransferase n=1 Tax=Bacillati TaxID=1783272 RepID=UPI00193AB30D|nr:MULTISPECIES: phosphatidate cytidylyltransferase [Terrabacteria group]MBW9212041.1 phosphatidate cytidylyltransferase [Trueperella sp. zg.1013]QRG87151.1 phosphatidate cytidylyltransferase [Bulleidia sp. zg-1006]
MNTLIKKTMWAIVLALIVMPPLLMGGHYVVVLETLIALASAYEIACLGDKDYLILNTAVNFGFMILMGMAPTLFRMMVIGGFLFLYFLFALTISNYTIEKTVYSFSMSLLVGLAIEGLHSIYRSSGTFGPRMMMFVFFACYACDSFAYICGFFFGKHKLAPKISPKKTWEGAIGGYLFGVAFAYVYSLIFLTDVKSWWLILVSLVLPFVAQIGDLSLSNVKRHFGIKDFSHLIPYHGGILDRIDSLVFCLMIMNGLLIAGGIV